MEAIESPRSFAADPVYAFVDSFFAALVECGVRHAIVSPGSRSTPLVLAAARCPGLRCRAVLDERSAGFFALGLAKTSRDPVALVCTSGTAAANYLPAVVEAHYARVPLLVLTADRPPELRECGAGQTIDQMRIYGSHVRSFTELPVLGEPGARVELARRVASRAVSHARSRPAGPVHLNWPLREPLEPVDASDADVAWGRLDSGPVDGARTPSVVAAELAPHPDTVAELAEQALRTPRGVIAAGPVDAGGDLAEAVTELARATGWPVFADPTSQLRRGAHTEGAPVLAHADHLLRDRGFADRHAPELVLRLGGSPTSKAFRLWVERHRPRDVILLDPDDGWSDPSCAATSVVRCDPATLCRGVARQVRGRRAARVSSPWLVSFLSAEARAAAAVDRVLSEEAALLEPAAVRTVCESLPGDAILYVSNSMPVRDLDGFLRVEVRPLRVLANRGANGIDGMVSSAAGAAAADAGPVVLLTGDLAFLHDVGGLLAARQAADPLTIVVLDNDGGGIFSYLPVADRCDPSEFETWFRTPHGLDLGRAAALYGLAFERVDDEASLRAALSKASASATPSVIVASVDRDANVAQHRAIAAAVAEALGAERVCA